MKNRLTGFSFIELIIALAIISILTLLAYPSYVQHRITANREQAKQLLQACAAELSLYHKTLQSYEDIALRPFPSQLQNVCNTPHIQTLKHESYQLKALSVNQHSYELVAQRQGTQIKDSCGDLVISQHGKKTLLNSQNTSLEDCW
ncbi:type IV pilin protein [Aliamphritea spongicola]|uniref:type IV pilin protein n=1 Tax=Aliamphritea spongicola TaxID=707589 RepID=UPI00196A438E|nr:type IV pilin protein [Aliamphritea spongicola]MBN3562474.1 prepilin-type N-terminal cleavage/methylation domain-containing protein [Aliamphritea spongicola]